MSLSPGATPMAETAISETYRIVRSVYFSPAHLALTRRYSDLTNALADMGDGIVVSGDGTHIAAFHERHLACIEHRLSHPPS